MLAFLSFVAPERQEQAKRTTNTSFTFIIRTQRSLIELYKQTNKQTNKYTVKAKPSLITPHMCFIMSITMPPGLSFKAQACTTSQQYLVIK